MLDIYRLGIYWQQENFVLPVVSVIYGCVFWEDTPLRTLTGFCGFSILVIISQRVSGALLIFFGWSKVSGSSFTQFISHVIDGGSVFDYFVSDL